MKDNFNMTLVVQPSRETFTIIMSTASEHCISLSDAVDLIVSQWRENQEIDPLKGSRK